MWREAHELPSDGRQSETALMIARGVRRLLRARGFSSLTELSLADGRRADIAAVNRDGEVLIVEIKSSPADFRADRKWRSYAACCDRLYFAISERTPADLMPLDAGLIVADPYGAEIVREAELRAHGARQPPRALAALRPNGRGSAAPSGRSGGHPGIADAAPRGGNRPIKKAARWAASIAGPSTGESDGERRFGPLRSVAPLRNRGQ